MANERTDQELLATLASWLPSSCQPAWAAAACCALGLLLFLALSWRTKPIYLLDFACYRPPNDLKVTYTRFMQGSRDSGVSGGVGAEEGVCLEVVRKRDCGRRFDTCVLCEKDKY